MTMTTTVNKHAPVTDDDFVLLPADHILRSCDYVGYTQPSYNADVNCKSYIGRTAKNAGFSYAWCKRKDYPVPKKTITLYEVLAVRDIPCGGFRTTQVTESRWVADIMPLFDADPTISKVTPTGNERKVEVDA